MGKTLHELERDMPPEEYIYWQGLALLKQYECPNCGLEARDMNKYHTVPVSCPICKTKWDRVVSHEQAKNLGV